MAKDRLNSLGKANENKYSLILKSREILEYLPKKSQISLPFPTTHGLSENDDVVWTSITLPLGQQMTVEVTGKLQLCIQHTWVTILFQHE